MKRVLWIGGNLGRMIFTLLIPAYIHSVVLSIIIIIIRLIVSSTTINESLSHSWSCEPQWSTSILLTKLSSISRSYTFISPSPPSFLLPFPSQTNKKQRQGFTRSQFLHLAILARDQLLQRLRRSSQCSKRFEVHRNHRLAVQQKLDPSQPTLSSYVIHSIGRFLRSHCVEIADTEQRNVRSVEIVNDLHVAERSGVSAVVNVMIFQMSAKQSNLLSGVWITKPVGSPP